MRKVIIAGGRDFATNDPANPRYKYREQDRKYGASCLYPLLTDFETEYRMAYDDLEIVSGGAMGADQLGEDYAVVHWVPVKVFKADWDKRGRAAGPLRNREMAEYANELIVFWDGKSRGTQNMIDTMLRLKKPVHVYFYGEDDA